MTLKGEVQTNHLTWAVRLGQEKTLGKALPPQNWKDYQKTQVEMMLCLCVEGEKQRNKVDIEERGDSEERDK